MTPHSPAASVSVTRKALFWLVVVAGIIALLYALSNVLLPFAAAALLAYLLNPAVNKLESHKLPRWLGSTIVLCLFFAALVGIIMLMVPLLQVQIAALSVKLPNYWQQLQETIKPLLAYAQGFMLNEPDDSDKASKITALAQEQAGNAFKVVSGIFNAVLTGGLQAISILSLLVLTPILAFYLLRDWNLMCTTIDSWFPRDYRTTILEQLHLIDQTIAGFIRGQLLVCLILATFYGIGLSVAGLEFGLVIGLLSGLISFIPYVGSIIGGLISIGMAFSQFGLEQWQSIAIIAAIYGAGQFLEGNVLSPKLVGSRVNLHPVWVIFALFAGGALFGFLGVLIAVPVTAVIGVLTRFAISQYKKSPYYHHDDNENRALIP